jgi:hypothetical protein
MRILRSHSTGAHRIFRKGRGSAGLHKTAWVLAARCGCRHRDFRLCGGEIERVWDWLISTSSSPVSRAT